MQFGAATVDITPERKLLLGGGLFGKATGTNDRLTATAFCFGENGRRVMLLSCDLIGFNNSLADSVRQDAAAATGIPRDAIVLAATHTHSGPATLDLRHWSASDPSYVRFLRDRLVRAARNAAAHMAPARLRWSSGPCPGIGVNRTSYGVAVDETLTVLRVEDPGGRRLLGMVANHGCHPVTMHGTRLYSADFPGVLRSEVSRKAGRRIPVMFLLGAAGDINPCGFAADLSGRVTPALLRSRRALCRKIGGELARRALAAPTRDGGARLEWSSIEVSLPLLPYPDGNTRRALRKAALSDIGRYRNDPAKAWPLAEALVMRDWLADAAAGGAKSLTVEIQAVRIGRVRVLAMPAELFAAHAMELRRNAGRAPLMVGTMCNGYNSYVTVDASIERQTYEAAGVPRLLGRQAYAKGVGRRMIAGAMRALRRLG
jgi:hypothetical protein